MSKFIGFSCDSCDAIAETQYRTKKITRYEGSILSGQFVEELCPACAVEPPHPLTPLRSRVKAVEATSSTASLQDDPSIA